MNQRWRVIISWQVILWVTAITFILTETNIIKSVPCSGILTTTIFGGIFFSIIKRKHDKYDLFCWYHKAMALLAAMVGVLDIIYFYNEFDSAKYFNLIIGGLKITLIIAVIQIVITWIKKRNAKKQKNTLQK